MQSKKHQIISYYLLLAGYETLLLLKAYLEMETII